MRKKALALAMAVSLWGQTPDPIQPFLTKYCAACHNDRQKVANLSFDSRASFDRLSTWEAVLDKLSAGQMPPKGTPQPPKSDLAVVTAWIEKNLGRSPEPVDDPGRVTARRLNRVEYNNTIRDLLGVSSRPADEFPVDDSGYGFDNIGDVLSLSPMLMEKYIAAAAKVSRLAVFGDTVPDKPTRLARLLGRRSHDANDVLTSGNYLPFSLRGSLYGPWVFPVDGEYEFRLRVANFRPNPVKPTRRGPRREPTLEETRAEEEESRTAAPPRKVVLTIDGASVLEGVVEGTALFGYHRGEFTARVPVKAGERALRASFPELADLDNPKLNINPDARRQLFVDYLEIIGPYQPRTGPPDSAARIFTCKADQPSCARTILSGLLRKAYRRPVTGAEIESKTRLVALAQQEGDSFEEGIRIAIEAILVSPNFLFRIEREPAGSQPVTDHELASRLSYFLWSSMPDDALSRAADRAELRKPGVLDAQVRRMLADPKASNLVDNFAAQWLQLRSLGRTKPDPARFPAVDDELLDAMRRETSLFVEAMIREDRSVLDFIDAPFTFLNGPLARHYGIAGVSGEQFRRVTLDGEQRSGLLTQGAILTVSSYPTRTSPPVRGKWVLENLLGTPPPPAPPDVPTLDESKQMAAASMRERMEQHRKDPSCSPCHRLMDPIGFGLERYDAVGAYRTHEGSIEIDPSGTLPDGQSFAGAKDLKAILKRQSGEFTHSLAEKLLTFALGRGLERYDRAVVDQISRQTAEKNYRFSALVAGIVNSKPFQMRSPDGGKSK